MSAVIEPGVPSLGMTHKSEAEAEQKLHCDPVEGRRLEPVQPSLVKQAQNVATSVVDYFAESLQLNETPGKPVDIPEEHPQAGSAPTHSLAEQAQAVASSLAGLVTETLKTTKEKVFGRDPNIFPTADAPDTPVADVKRVLGEVPMEGSPAAQPQEQPLEKPWQQAEAQEADAATFTKAAGERLELRQH
eukprot:RCo050804